MSPSTRVTRSVASAASRLATAAADEVVEHDDLGGTGVDELVDEGRADGAGASRDQHASSCQRGHRTDSSSAGRRRGRHRRHLDRTIPPWTARLWEAAARGRTATRRAAAPSVRGAAPLADAGGQLGDHAHERLALAAARATTCRRGGRRPCVAASAPTWPSTDVLAEVDAPVVDAEALLRVEVVPDEGTAGAADHHLADLGRAHPVDVDVGERAARQRQRDVADARPASTERVGADGRDARWGRVPRAGRSRGSRGRGEPGPRRRRRRAGPGRG